MKSLLLAFQFLTTFPIATRSDLQPSDYSGSLRWFFVVGFFIGVLQWLFALIGHVLNLPVDLLAVLIVLVGIIATGGLHLDGVADATDGFGGGYDRESILRIMKDDRLGVFGVAAIMITLYLKIIATRLILISSHNEFLILAPVVSRMCIACTCTLLPYAREEGTGKNFAEGNFIKHCFFPGILTILLCVLVLREGAVRLISVSIIASLIFVAYSKR